MFAKKMIVLAEDAREAGLLALGSDDFFRGEFTPDEITIIPLRNAAGIGKYTQYEVIVRG